MSTAKRLMTALSRRRSHLIRKGRELEQAVWTEFALRRIKRKLPKSGFIGPYEKARIPLGIYQEQWLWRHRHLIRGDVLDMSTPKHWHRYIHELASVSTVTISDIKPGILEKAGHTSPVELVGDFCKQKLPIPEKSFDTILCISILEHCVDPQAMVTNSRRLLRPGGIAFFICPYANIDGHTGEMCPDYWRFGRDGYLLLAQRAQLAVVETGGIGELGRSFLSHTGADVSANSWHRGVPIANWMICRKEA
jgi:SAM-dependent methyltransferase